MQYQPNNKGIVQWVVPRSNRPKTTTPSPGSKEHTRQHTLESTSSVNSTIDSSNIHVDNDSQQSSLLISGRIANNNSKQHQQPFLDISDCRTICTLAEGHLKELIEHQQSINRARSKLVHNNNPHNQQQESINSAAFIARNDNFNLKIRDEQTKAIETIKQLNNYLRELSHLIKQCDLVGISIEKQIVNKLSDTRTNIIQALNDFVLSNIDIDIPIIDCKDQHDYDLCIDAHVETSAKPNQINDCTNKSTTSQDSKNSNGTTTQNKCLTTTRQAPGGSNNPNERSDVNDLELVLTQPEVQTASHEKRNREIEKLKRDTEELRQLFLDFYILVRSQGETIDSIENNTVITTQRVKEGHEHLSKVKKGLAIVVPVVTLITGALIAGPIGIMIGGKTGAFALGCVTTLMTLASSYSVQQCMTVNKV